VLIKISGFAMGEGLRTIGGVCWVFSGLGDDLDKIFLGNKA